MATQWKSAGTRIRHDLLYRLRWNLLSPLSAITIVTGPSDSEKTSPFLSHLLANEPIAFPPISRLEMGIRACEDKRSYDNAPEEYRYEPPLPLLIDNVDGRPITLREFVTQAHIYLDHHMAEIKRIKGESYGVPSISEDGVRTMTTTYGISYLPPNIGFFFKHVWGMVRGDEVKFSVVIFAEGERWTTLDMFWEAQMNHARRLTQERENPLQPPVVQPAARLPSPEEHLRLLNEARSGSGGSAAPEVMRPRTPTRT